MTRVGAWFRQALSPSVELRAFLEHSRSTGDELATGWALLAATGMRRGEAIALRWGDVDLDAGRLSVRRAGTLVKDKGGLADVRDLGMAPRPPGRRTTCAGDNL